MSATLQGVPETTSKAPGDREPGTPAPAGPRFDGAVAPGGYRWWYVDALSDDGRHGLVVIAFVGSVFSPYYWWAGHRAPEDHVCINVALYGPRERPRPHWAMTERGAGALDRGAAHFRVGASGLAWDDGRLTIDIDERTTPFPRLERGYPLRARITLEAEALATRTIALDPAGRHRWQPIAPIARVRLDAAEPALAWSGHGYLDTNDGDEMLEAGFRRWDWSRARMADGTARLLYDCTGLDGTRRAFGFRIARDGTVAEAPVPEVHPLPRGLWGVRRETPAEAPPRLVQAFEDAPFYTRAAIATRIDGEDCLAVHETFDGRRFASPVVKGMLTMRMPRRRRWPRTG
ncbi:MAG: carotenoid 1,2-hydratase [Pseudomonadota bacterium]